METHLENNVLLRKKFYTVPKKKKRKKRKNVMNTALEVSSLTSLIGVYAS
jgi:hypothetical protein